MAASLDNLVESLDELYPHVARWILGQEGTIELGQDGDNPSNSQVRVFDDGGIVWEGEDTYESLDDLFDDLEAMLEEEFEDD